MGMKDRLLAVLAGLAAVAAVGLVLAQPMAAAGPLDGPTVQAMAALRAPAT